MQTIAVLTSGGDSPGMNAALRAVVRTAIYAGKSVIGIRRGYEGLLESDMFELNVYSVADILQRGGTILCTARSEAMKTREGVKKAAAILDASGVSSLVVIGGDGSYKGALALSAEGVPVACLPATIDNDVPSTDYTIGFDTAVNTAIDALSKIRDSSYSNDRVDVIEVMGRGSGNIALQTGIAGGAEAVIVPEAKPDMDFIVRRILAGKRRGKLHSICVYAEGAGDAAQFCEEIAQRASVKVKMTRLGYVQRGGSPSAFDRVLASHMGNMAVESLLAGRKSQAICLKGGRYSEMALEEAAAAPYRFQEEALRLAMVLSI